MLVIIFNILLLKLSACYKMWVRYPLALICTPDHDTHIRLSYKSYFFCQPTMFFYDKSANSIFSHNFSD